jgi:glycosyltransferase involved in cell wall biosynthesis
VIDGGAPRVSVILAAYNSDQTVASSLSAILAQTFRDFEVVVVDSSPDDRTLRIVRDRFPGVRIEHREQRLLPQHARNRGVELARGEILVFTDPDCHADPEWLERLVAAFDAGHPIVSGSMTVAPARWLDWGVHLSKFSWLLPGLPPGPCATVCTANAAYARSAFERVGPFNADVCIGDALLSWRARAAGLAPWFEPGAVVEHRHEHGFAKYVREFFHRGRELVVVLGELEEWGTWRMLSRAIGFPLVVAVELARGARCAVGARCVRQWGTSLPAQIVFKTAWALGESVAAWSWLLGPTASTSERLRALHP